MSKTDRIHECDGLSSELKKILAKAGILTFTDLSKYTCLNLLTTVPTLKVRHLANLKHALNERTKRLVPDDSIKLDQFINQRKLFNLWEKGIQTYKELDALPYAEFVEAVGGPQSRFFRNKALAKKWLEENGLTEKKHRNLPHLTLETAQLLYEGGFDTLQEVAKKSDFELVRVLQHNNKPAAPLTRARLIEIRYALYKEGITRPCKPL